MCMDMSIVCTLDMHRALESTQGHMQIYMYMYMHMYMDMYMSMSMSMCMHIGAPNTVSRIYPEAE